MTKVYYAAASSKRAAQDVAKQLDVAAANVLAANPAITRQVVSASADEQVAGADVVVLLGADKATG